MDKDAFTNELEEDGKDWIVTYSDLMTLLLVFFVLLYSISSLNIEKFRLALNSIQISLGEGRPPIDYVELAGVEEALSKPMALDDMTGLRSRRVEALREIRDFITDNGLERNIEVLARDGKIVIRISGTVLFQSGVAELNNAGIPVLEGIVQIVDKFFEFNINIKGHTDNVPISTKQFPSNWELSAIRATTVLKYLVDRGIDPERLTATGYGELLPLYPNYSAENRARNRRVEFVLEKAGQ